MARDAENEHVVQPDWAIETTRGGAQFRRWGSGNSGLILFIHGYLDNAEVWHESSRGLIFPDGKWWPSSYAVVRPAVPLGPLWRRTARTVWMSSQSCERNRRGPSSSSGTAWAGRWPPAVTQGGHVPHS